MNVGNFRPDITKGESIPSLESLYINIPDLDGLEENYSPEPEIKQVMFNGKVLNLDINKNIQILGQGNFSVYIQAGVSTNTPETIASVVVTIEKIGRGPDIQGTINVKNHSREMKGLGRALWTSSLKLIQQFANQRGVPVKHLLIKNPREGDGLTSAKWDELFFPLIEQHQYVKLLHTDPPMWEKTYLPEQK